MNLPELFFIAKGENVNDEYSVGDIVGKYEIKGTIGRGFINQFFFFKILIRVVRSCVSLSTFTNTRA
jgi:hypothetical protein